jgi:hypothetical protein
VCEVLPGLPQHRHAQTDASQSRACIAAFVGREIEQTKITKGEMTLEQLDEVKAAVIEHMNVGFSREVKPNIEQILIAMICRFPGIHVNVLEDVIEKIYFDEPFWRAEGERNMRHAAALKAETRQLFPNVVEMR